MEYQNGREHTFERPWQDVFLLWFEVRPLTAVAWRDRKPKKTVILSRGPAVNAGGAEYEPAMLLTRPWRSVELWRIGLLAIHTQIEKPALTKQDYKSDRYKAAVPTAGNTISHSL
jgi:hypothetical protein